MPHPATGLGRRLKERRADAKGTHRHKSQAKLAGELRTSQTTISNLENEHLADTIGDWRPEDLYDLFLAYGLTPSEMLEWARDYELDRLHKYLTDREHMYSVEEGSGKVRFLGAIGPGRFDESRSEDLVEYRACPDDIAKKYRLEDVFSVVVNGDSMLADSVRDTIPPCSVVFLHSKLQPEPGEIISAYLPKEDQTILTRFDPSGSYTLLRSSNDRNPPIVLDEDAEMVVQGVHLSHEVRGPRLQ